MIEQYLKPVFCEENQYLTQVGVIIFFALGYLVMSIINRHLNKKGTESNSTERIINQGPDYDEFNFEMEIKNSISIEEDYDFDTLGEKSSQDEQITRMHA